MYCYELHDLPRVTRSRQLLARCCTRRTRRYARLPRPRAVRRWPVRRICGAVAWRCGLLGSSQPPIVRGSTPAAAASIHDPSQPCCFTHWPLGSACQARGIPRAWPSPLLGRHRRRGRPPAEDRRHATVPWCHSNLVSLITSSSLSLANDQAGQAFPPTRNRDVMTTTS
jgi:hypothetical protein